MAKYSRVTAKVFGETASTSNTPKEIGQFGSAKAGTYNATGDIATIQGLPAWSNGWIDAVTPTQQFPSLPEMTGVHKVLSQQIAYTLQQGIPEWDSATTYYINGFCSKGGKIYISQSDNNLNNDPESDTVNWQEFTSGSSRNIGEIVASTIPLTDAGLHLLDGALISGSGSYAGFVTYIADLYDSGDYTDIFETEANWQTSVTTYGVCDKFVYDSINQTVRLPKYNSKIYTGGGNAPVIGTGAMGLKNCSTSSDTNPYELLAHNQSNGQWLLADYNGNYPAQSQKIGLASDSTKSGIIADLANITTSLDGYYYIVIANTAKTQIQVDIDEIATDLNGKADVDLTNATPTSAFGTALNTAGIRTVVETYVNGTSWYRVYSDKWCEQGGQVNVTTTPAEVQLLKQMADTNYSVFVSSVETNAGYGASAGDLTVSNFKIRANSNDSRKLTAWLAVGYTN